MSSPLRLLFLFAALLATGFNGVVASFAQSTARSYPKRCTPDYALEKLAPPTLSKADLEAEPKIFGGTKAGKSEFPFQVALLCRSDMPAEIKDFVCGGTLIARDWVLTAAHCLRKLAYISQQERVSTESADFLDVLVGTNVLGLGGDRLGVRQVIIHPDYNAQRSEHDIALLKIPGDALPRNVQPVTLASLDDEKRIAEPAAPALGRLADQLTVVGWGATEQSTISQELLKVEVPVQSNAVCAASYPGEISETMLCAGLMVGGKDSCQGDSGGFFGRAGHGPIHAGHGPIQVGIVSWGRGCGLANYFGVYTRVSHYRWWIQEQQQRFR